MLSRGPMRSTARSLMRCPLPFCPAPTLFVGKRKRSGLRHCIGCWRQFAPGATRFSNSQLAVQVSPRKRWLRRYSPHQRKRGPPPAVLLPNPTECVFWQKAGDACSWISRPTWPGRRPSAGTDSDMSPRAISSSVSEDDEDLNSTARSRRPTGADEESSADSSPVEYSQFGSNTGWDTDTASNTGSDVSEPEVEEPDAKELRLSRLRALYKREKIECAIGGHQERVPETNDLEVEDMKRRKLVAKESKQARGAAVAKEFKQAVQHTRAVQPRQECARTRGHLWKAHEHFNNLGGCARNRGSRWWKEHEQGCARTWTCMWGHEHCNEHCIVVNLKGDRN